MSGLDGILEAIAEKGEKEAKSILASFSEKASDNSEIILKNAKIECEKAIKSVEMEGENILREVYASAKSKSSQKILQLKHELITQVIETAKKRLLSMKNEEYFCLMYRRACLSLENKCGEICFNLNDRLRLPRDFIEKLNAVGIGSVVLSDTCADIQGGFILTYEKTSENCSLETMIEEKRDEITQAVACVLFRGGDALE